MRQRDPARDLCRAGRGIEKEPPKTGAGQVPTKGRERFHEDHRAIKILRNVAASSNVIAISHNFTLHVKLITTVTSATPAIITIITIVHGGHVPSTTSVERAALGHVCFVSCDPATLLPWASNDWLRLASTHRLAKAHESGPL